MIDHHTQIKGNKTKGLLKSANAGLCDLLVYICMYVYQMTVN